VPPAPAIFFLTLGCPKNEVDTDRMRAAVRAAGYAVTDEAETADVAVVNTCAFIEDATAESISVIFEVARDWLPYREGRHVVVSGCMPSRYGEDLAASMPEVSAFVPVTDESAILDVLERLVGPAAGAPATPCPTRSVEGFSAYLQISDGCHRSCAYCTIPAIRGPYRSRQIADIVAEAAELVALGAREIVLIGQDISAWGRDLPGEESLADVVRAVAAVEGLDWLRLMYVQPDGVTDELLAAMAQSPNVVRYLDIPLQHASAAVLRRMRRSGSREKYLALLQRIRAALPDVVLRTTLIAGFPGEARADVNELVRFLDEARFDYAGVFVYSPEEGTAAAAMPDQVPLRTRRARAQRLRDVADHIGFAKAAEKVGATLDVLVEGVDPDEDVVVGRWRGQAPEVDGIVMLDGGRPGDLLHARIVDALGYDLEGEVIP
jgi:ribosomal protein S12 methylthiotransferase